MFNDKKSLSKKCFFSIITKNLNWDILIKHLVTFIRWDGFKIEKCLRCLTGF